MTSIAELLCEYRTNPLGIDITTPRLSWQMQTDRSGAHQTAYRVLAASAPELLRDGSFQHERGGLHDQVGAGYCRRPG